MLINLRNALMSGKRLPYDAEVEWLESTGTQWIDTGYSFNSSTDSVELTFELLSSTQRYKWIFGAYDTKRLALGSGDGTNMRRLAYNETATYENDSFYLGGPHVYFANSTGAGIDGQKMIDFASFSTSSNILLYTIPLNTTNYCSHSRIWSYKHYRNGVLVRDFIPVRKGTVGYFYDRVSGKLFGNAGTGDFVLGPDVVPVEWLSSDGNAYINTGVIPADDIGARATFTVSALGTDIDNYVLGSRAVGAARFYLYNNESSQFVKYGWGSMITTSSPVVLNQKITASLNYCNDRKFVFNASEVQSALPTADFSANVYPMFLFGANFAGRQISSAVLQGGIYDCKITKGATPVRSFRSVRVGTDATSWEGAMMDVLTRRIYRNAGTGTFTYGNDLKYPIPAE